MVDRAAEAQMHYNTQRVHRRIDFTVVLLGKVEKNLREETRLCSARHIPFRYRDSKYFPQNFRYVVHFGRLSPLSARCWPHSKNTTSFLIRQLTRRGGFFLQLFKCLPKVPTTSRWRPISAVETSNQSRNQAEREQHTSHLPGDACVCEGVE